MYIVGAKYNKEEKCMPSTNKKTSNSEELEMINTGYTLVDEIEEIATNTNDAYFVNLAKLLRKCEKKGN